MNVTNITKFQRVVIDLQTSSTVPMLTSMKDTFTNPHPLKKITIHTHPEMLYYHDFENSGMCGFIKQTLWNTGKKLFKNLHEMQPYMCDGKAEGLCDLTWG
jgi:hypothetical protein